MWMYGIYDKDGKLDCDPEPMVFRDRSEAVDMLTEYEEGYYVDNLMVPCPEFVARVRKELKDRYGVNAESYQVEDYIEQCNGNVDSPWGVKDNEDDAETVAGMYFNDMGE